MPETSKIFPAKRMFAALRDRAFWRAADRFIFAWGPLLLAVFAVFYYGQYYRSGLNLSGEGGTTAVIAMRLNEGWLPIKDTFLGYNVMWFYPVAWLFRWLGPDYIALRIYFFVLCWLAALMAFLVVRRVNGRGWYALGVGLLIATIPGMLFRNYMGFLPLLNVWALLGAFVFEPRTGWRRWTWFAVAGLALGITFLIRVEIGNFMLIIYAGLALLYPWGTSEGFLHRASIGMGGLALCLLVALGLQWPFYQDAQRRGFAKDFTEQYVEFWRRLPYEMSRHFPGKTAAAVVPTDTSRLAAGESAGILRIRNTTRLPKNWRTLLEAERRKTRQRDSLADLFRGASGSAAIFILALHLPILISLIVIVVAGCALAWAVVRANAPLKERALVSLVTLGCALTLFPQYFFFRPDTPHLSEFMVPFLVAMACVSAYAVGTAWRSRRWWLRVVGFGFAGLCLVSEGLYFYHSFPKESAGTIAAARKRSHEFVAENNVRVRLKKGERAWMEGLRKAVMSHSDKKDWVTVFPYAPTINFMTDRPSYLANLYVDNASAERDFTRLKIAEIERYRPAVIVVDQRDINGTEFSRFRNWAAPAYNFIRQHYVQVGIFDENEVYVRPDKIPAQT